MKGSDIKNFEETMRLSRMLIFRGSDIHKKLKYSNEEFLKSGGIKMDELCIEYFIADLFSFWFFNFIYQ